MCCVSALLRHRGPPNFPSPRAGAIIYIILYSYMYVYIIYSLGLADYFAAPAFSVLRCVRHERKLPLSLVTGRRACSRGCFDTFGNGFLRFVRYPCWFAAKCRVDRALDHGL